MKIDRKAIPPIWRPKALLFAGLMALAAVPAAFLALAWLDGLGPKAAFADETKPALVGEMGDFIYFASPKPVPPITFSDGTGKTLSLADFKGQVVLVNFWATWCAPCVREMPSLDRLQARFGGKDFTVVDIALDRQGKDAVEPYFARNGLDHLGIYLDPKGESFRAWSGRGVPTSFLIGRDGLSRGVLVGGALWDSVAAVKLIQHAIGEGRDQDANQKQTTTGMPPSPTRDAG
ncbi:MAG TPA: TlpA disulfide reductase family protein [Alphaproteobacteria bacterium]|nr:TlpA disulfide reductase family protein [Alphaproteobacteria bacterium]